VTMLPVAILAGGLATRLRPITERVPKALLEVAGRPFIFHQLDLLTRQGIERVVLCVGYLGEEVRAVVGDGRAHGLAVDYSFDGSVPLGTGGALACAIPKLGDRFFVLYGDSYLPCSFRDIQAAFEASDQPAMMTVMHNKNRWEVSNVLFKAGQILMYNKRVANGDMEHVDYGLSVLSASVFEECPRDRAFDLAEVLETLASRSMLGGYEVFERFYEIGSRRGITDTEAFLRSREGVR